MVQALDANGSQERDEVYLHSDNHSVTGVGSALSSTSVDSGWWHSANKGTVNDDGFVHLCFTRTDGDWKIYWNGTVLGNSISADSGTLEFNESNVDEFWLGRSFLNQDYVPAFYRDIAFFNAALDDTEVVELYNSGNFFDVRTHSQVERLGLYWPCQDELEFSGAGPEASLDHQGNSGTRPF